MESSELVIHHLQLHHMAVGMYKIRLPYLTTDMTDSQNIFIEHLLVPGTMLDAKKRQYHSKSSQTSRKKQMHEDYHGRQNMFYVFQRSMDFEDFNDTCSFHLQKEKQSVWAEETTDRGRITQELFSRFFFH